MGRKAKVLPIDVLDMLKANGQITRAKIASELNCHPLTVTGKVSRLIKDGENIGFNRKGLFILNKKDVQSQEDAELAMGWNNHVINVIKMWIRRGNNHRSVAIEARKRLGKELTLDERKILKQQLLLITRVVDAIDLDEELGS